MTEAQIIVVLFGLWAGAWTVWLWSVQVQLRDLRIEGALRDLEIRNLSRRVDVVRVE